MKVKRNKHTTTVSIYADQLNKFKELGGSAWLRNAIDNIDLNLIDENSKLSEIAISAIKKMGILRIL